MAKDRKYVMPASQEEVFQLWLGRLKITNASQYIMSGIGREEVAEIDQKLALIPRSIEKALAYLYAIAVSGDLSEPDTYEAMTYFIKKGVGFSERIKHVDKYWQKEWRKHRPKWRENPFVYGHAFWSSPEFHEWESDIAMFEFYKAAYLQGSYDEAFAAVINSCRELLGELIMLLSSENKRFHLNRVAWMLSSISRTTWLRKDLLSVCQEILSLVPPPSTRGFWRTWELLEKYDSGKRDSTLLRSPGIELSAQIALAFLKLSTRWDDVVRVAQWLTHKQLKLGYWNEYYISDPMLRRKLYNQDYYERSKFQPTCLVAELMKRVLLDKDNNWLSKTKQWILKQQDPRGFWNHLAIGVVDPTTLALESLDTLSLPTSQAFVFPEASRDQIDELSNLPNKNYFISLFKAICNLVQQKQIPLTLIMMDFSKFKAINDNLGQTVGDQVIKNFGRHLTQHFGQSGSPIRWGGDEFVIIFKPSVKKDEVKNITYRMLDIWSPSVSEVSKQFHPLVRVGLACYPDDNKPPQELEGLASARLKTLKGIKVLSHSVICDTGI